MRFLLQSEEAPIDDLMELVQQIVAFHMKVCSFQKFYLVTPVLQDQKLLVSIAVVTPCVMRQAIVFFFYFLSNISIFALQHNAEPEAVDLLMEVFI